MTHLDLSQAYQQLLLYDQSKDYVVINTYHGTIIHHLEYYQLQEYSNTQLKHLLLQGIESIVVYGDDILCLHLV